MSEKHSQGFKLYTSNRMELLADACAKTAAPPLASPLDREMIVVPNRGMERWLSMQLADRLGAWANARYLLPNAFVEYLFSRIFTDFPDERLVDASTLTWHLMAALAKPLPDKQEYSQLARYLNDGRLQKRFQLATKIADTFDQYMVYRPDLLLSWEEGADTHWQADLWRELSKRIGGRHRARLWRAFFSVAGKLKASMFPERVIVFGHSSLPPFHTSLLSAVASFIPVHLFVLNPSGEYWDEIVSDREADRLRRKQLTNRTNESASIDLHLDPGVSLLGALGGYGRDFIAALHDLDVEETALPHEPGDATLLNAIQSDLLHLRNRGSSPDAPRRAVSPDDCSIRVHSCHGPLREVEVLYDTLLDNFERDPSLNPSDILVMTPDIEAYAPFIRAVFDAPEARSMKIPYAITDLSGRESSSIADSFLALISIPHSRFEADRVAALLDVPEIRAAFSIEEQEVAPARSWIAESGVRWGIDATTQTDRGLPATPETTWKAGAERLLLGYALPSEGERLFAGIAPCDPVEGIGALLVGKLADFIEKLSAFSKAALVNRSPLAWSDQLIALLETFFSVKNDRADELATLRSLVYALRAPETSGVFRDAIDLEIVLDYFGQALAKPSTSAPFLSGGVTFCAMMPMRSIPFRAVCCIGMNDDAFPRRSYHASWDLIAAKPRPGDRSLEREDRYLFLEALLSARDRFFLSYTGQSARDNAICRPSIVIEELLRYLDRGYFPIDDTGKEAPELLLRERIVVGHCLQGWSPAYFLGNRELFSYSSGSAAAASIVIGKTASPSHPEFCPDPLAPAPDAVVAIDLHDLIAFFKNPSRYFCNERLGLTLDKSAEKIETAELFSIEGLDRFRLGNEMVAHRLEDASEAEVHAVLKAQGRLPLGGVGEYGFDALSGATKAFVNTLKPFLSVDLAQPPLSAEIQAGPVTIRGTVSGLYGSGLAAYRFADITPADYLTLWISHLFLCARAPRAIASTSRFFGRDGMFRLNPAERPIDELQKLTGWFERGLRQPLPFFPKSSFAYAKKILDGNDTRGRGDALDRALTEWNGNDFVGGEKADPYFSYCFRQGFEGDASFIAPALEIWQPIFGHLAAEEA
jgi:exodeoxyribonuclease V gamma subunit